MLTCSCPDYDGEPGSWMYYPPDDFEKFSETKRTRCRSCRELIDQGADCLRFRRCRGPHNEFEEQKYGGGAEIKIADYFMCENCGEIYLNLEAIGYCLNITDNMGDSLHEYHVLTGFNPAAVPQGSAKPS